MKKQFILNYTGQKYDETKKNFHLYPNINDFTTIVEPFAGSFGFIRYIYEQNPNLNFIVYDSNKDLIDFYNFLKNNTDEENAAFLKLYNDTLETYPTLENNKLQGNKKQIININNEEQNHYLKFIVKTNVLQCVGICKLNKKTNVDFSIFKKINFINEKFEDIDFNIYDKKTTLYYLDPPYFTACNEYYTDTKIVSLFDKFFNLFENNNALFVHNMNPLIHQIFKNWVFNQYNKKYGLTRKEVVHMIYYNKI